LGLVPKTNTKAILGISIAAVAMMFVASPAIVEAVSSFSSVGISGEDQISAVISSDATINTANAAAGDDAYGYGIISDAGLDAILVTTTHGGIQDSSAQTGPEDASFHNHYVALTADNDLCIDNVGTGTLAIVDISFDAPGDVNLFDDAAVFSGPTEFENTHSLSGEEVEFKTDGTVGAVVSFSIVPLDKDGNVTLDPLKIIDDGAVCIANVAAATSLDVHTP